MPAVVTKPERDLIQRVLQFANMTIRNTAQVERIFAASPLVRLPFQVITPDEVQRYVENQVEVRDALADIVSRDPVRRRRAADLAHGRIGQTVGWRITNTSKGDYGIEYNLEPHAAGVVASCWLVIGFHFFDSSKGLLDRLGQCGAPGCGKFNLRFSGRPQRHCSMQHRIAFEATLAAQRQRESRARRQRRKGD